MTLDFYDSMGIASTAQILAEGVWTSIGNGIVGGGRWGNYCLWTAGNSAVRTLSASHSEYIVGASFMTNHRGSGPDVFLRNSTTTVLRLSIVDIGAGALRFRLLNSAGTILGTGSQPVVADVWYHLQIRVKVHASTGEAELRVNGLAGEINVSGVNTGSSNVDNIMFDANGAWAYWCDITGVDPSSGSSPYNTFLGDVRSVLPAPTGNSGTDNAWTANTGTKYGAVDDDPSTYDGDTTYISSSTPGDRQGFTNAALGVTGTVLAVQTNIIARKDDANPRTVAPTVRQASTTYDGTTTPGLGTTYARYKQLYTVAPDGSAWDVTRVNAAEFGVKMVS